MKIRNQLYIDGKWRNARSGQTIAVINPATNKVITKVQKAGEKEILEAIAAAKRAFHGSWGPMNAFARSQLLHKVGAVIESNLAFIAGVETDDVGKPIFESKNVDVASAAATFHYFGSSTFSVGNFTDQSQCRLSCRKCHSERSEESRPALSGDVALSQGDASLRSA